MNTRKIAYYYNAQESMEYVLQCLNMNCWENFWLDPNLVQVIAGLEWWGLEKYQRISKVQNEEMKEEKMIQDTREMVEGQEHRGRC